MRVDTLLLKDGTYCDGTLVVNDILRERVWKCGEKYIFECNVQKVNPEVVLSESE